MKTNDLIISDDISRDRFEIICYDALRLTSFTKFLIGDIVNVAKLKGWTGSEEYQKFILSTGYAIRTIQEFAMVSSRVPKEIRQESISFSHYTLLSPLKQEQQKQKLLDIIERGLSVRQLKNELQPNELHPVSKMLQERVILSHREAKYRMDNFNAELEFFKGYKFNECDNISEMDMKFILHRSKYEFFLWNTKEPYPKEFISESEIDTYVERSCISYYKYVAEELTREMF